MTVTLMEAGKGESEARTLVQLSNGATTFNTTLNLTGPLLLGVTIASASLLYAWYARFPPRKSGGYGRYNKRSVGDDEEEHNRDEVLGQVLESFELLQSLEDSLSLIGLDTDQCKLRAVCDIVQDTYPSPAVDTVTQVVKMTLTRIRKIGLSLVQPVLSPWVRAAEEGKRGDLCEKNYIYCEDILYDKKLMLQTSNW